MQVNESAKIDYPVHGHHACHNLVELLKMGLKYAQGQLGDIPHSNA